MGQGDDLVITNTFLEHKNIHKYTRKVISRRDIDILDGNNNGNIILDTKEEHIDNYQNYSELSKSRKSNNVLKSNSKLAPIPAINIEKHRNIHIV